MNEELQVLVSPICHKDGKKMAYVSFSDGTKEAEGTIPECKMIKNEGFTDEEVACLELYMKTELPNLKKMAASANPFNAMRK